MVLHCGTKITNLCNFGSTQRNHLIEEPKLVLQCGITDKGHMWFRTILQFPCCDVISCRTFVNIVQTVKMRTLLFVVYLITFVTAIDDCRREYPDEGNGHHVFSGVDADIIAPWIAAIGNSQGNQGRQIQKHHHYFWLQSRRNR